jgi:hypothetical protein
VTIAASRKATFADAPALTQQTVNYTTLTTTVSAETSLTLNPPPNTTALYLYGLVDPYTAPHFVDVQPPLANRTTNNAPGNQTFNGTNSWVSADQVMYAAQLELGTQYTVVVTFNDSAGYLANQWSLGSIVYVQTD